MHWIDWCIVIDPLAALLALAVYSGRYVRGVVDFSRRDASRGVM